MILFGSVALGLLAGILRGGRLDALARLPFRWLWLIPVGLVLRYLAFSDALLSRAEWLSPVVYGASVFVLAVILVRNIALMGTEFLLLGLACNALVIFSNGGHMPVAIDAIRATGRQSLVDALLTTGKVAHAIIMTNETHFRWLGDIFPIPPQLPFPSVFSLGDLFTAVGVLILLALGTMDSAVRPLPWGRAHESVTLPAGDVPRTSSQV